MRVVSKRTKRKHLLECLSTRNIDHPRKMPLYVLRKSVEIVLRLENGEPYWRLRGKRLHYDRNVISIPVGRNWRLLARDERGNVKPIRIMSHEDYNGLTRRMPK